jgi:amidase
MRARGEQPNEKDNTGASAVPVKPFEFEETTIAELQEAMRSGRHTARSITQAYLERIQDVDKQGASLNSIIELNPDALAMAENLDNERRAGRVRGALHGIPILIKDNIDTADRMQTTAGSLALVGQPAPRDAYIVEKLRENGAVILGKTNLSEWANIRSKNSTSGWSGRGGLTRNPFVLDRNPSGSSSGSGAATSANLCAAAIGTETDGSIISPASACGLVGIKPTVGLLSRSGIIPISHSQDTPGPTPPHFSARSPESIRATPRQTAVGVRPFPITRLFSMRTRCAALGLELPATTLASANRSIN